MRRSLARFSEPESSVHTRSLAGFITCPLSTLRKPKKSMSFSRIQSFEKGQVMNSRLFTACPAHLAAQVFEVDNVLLGAGDLFLQHSAVLAGEFRQGAAGGLDEELHPAGFLQHVSGDDRLLEASSRDSEAVVLQQHCAMGPQRPGDLGALFLLADQVVCVREDRQTVTEGRAARGVYLQGAARRGKRERPGGMGVHHGGYVRARPKDFRMDVD